MKRNCSSKVPQNISHVQYSVTSRHWPCVRETAWCHSRPGAWLCKWRKKQRTGGWGRRSLPSSSSPSLPSASCEVCLRRRSCRQTDRLRTHWQTDRGAGAATETVSISLFSRNMASKCPKCDKTVYFGKCTFCVCVCVCVCVWGEASTAETHRRYSLILHIFTALRLFKPHYVYNNPSCWGYVHPFKWQGIHFAKYIF